MTKMLKEPSFWFVMAGVGFALGFVGLAVTSRPVMVTRDVLVVVGLAVGIVLLVVKKRRAR